MSLTPSSTCLVPLYTYPANRQTWDPLYNAISTHPGLNFVVVVNPNSGPGLDPDGWLPDKHYIHEVPRLNNFKNVTTIGYVRLDYGRRPIEEVEQDVRKYAHWQTGSTDEEGHKGPRSSSLDQAVRGIFLDEVPNVWSDDAAEYLNSVDKIIKEMDGILGDRLIVHNPGTIPDVEYANFWASDDHNGSLQPDGSEDGSASAETTNDDNDSAAARFGPDITIIFEESYATWSDPKVQTRLTELLRCERAACCFVVHSVPRDVCKTLIQELRERGGCIFVTELSENYYESFGDSWDETIDTIGMVTDAKGGAAENGDYEDSSDEEGDNDASIEDAKENELDAGAGDDAAHPADNEGEESTKDDADAANMTSDNKDD